MRHSQRSTSQWQESTRAIGTVGSGAVSGRAEKANVATFISATYGAITVYTLTATYNFRKITLLLPLAIALPVKSSSISFSEAAYSLGKESLTLEAP